MLQTVLTTKRPTKNITFKVRHDYGHIPAAKIEAYGRPLLMMIKRELGNASFFTREDLLQQDIFKHVATIYRYSLICSTVRFLIDRGDLVEKNRTDICLAGEQEKKYDPTPLSQTYYETICSIILSMESRSKVTVMDIVSFWRTDPHLTVNNKRVAVRRAISKLIKDGYLKKINDFEFMVAKHS